MSFDLTVVFTGLVGFVENTNAASQARMCALLVNGEKARKSSLDGTQMRRHRAFVKFPIGNVSSLSDQLEAQPMGLCAGLWYLGGDRISFEVAEAPSVDPHVNDFQVQRLALPPGVPHPRVPGDVPSEDWYSFTWALDMQRVCSSFHVDASLLGATPPRQRLAAQVFIDRGKVSTKTTTRAVWRFDPTLSSANYEQVFAHEVKLQYKGLVAARMVASSFEPDKKPKLLDLTSLQRGGSLLIEIVNTCDDNALQWPREDDPKDDEDTKWIFELLHPDTAALIKAKLEKEKLPLPIPKFVEVLPGGPGAPGSGNCIPPRLASTAFSHPELDKSRA